MGYCTSYYGEIGITPPLSWGEVKDSPWLSNQHGDLMLHLVEEQATEDTDEGTSVFVQKTADAVMPVTEDAYKGYQIVEHLQQIIDAFPGHTWTGHINAEGEEAGDMWRLAVKNGRAVKIQPRIVWPDEGGAS